MVERLLHFQTWSLAVTEGERINITFVYFDIEYENSCSYDWLAIDDEKYCGEIPTPWTIITNSNTATASFISDGSVTHVGFLAVWTSTTEESTTLEPPTNPPPTATGCEICAFPFTFGGTTFDTCIIVQDIDTQPWCSNSTSSISPSKIPCSDSDSLCPSTPPLMLITSPNYPQNYPNNADQVRD